MPRFATLIALPAWLLCLAAASAQTADKPDLHYWHLWVDRGGMSHLTRCAFTGLVLKNAHPPAPPQWQDTPPGQGSVIFETQPAGYEGAWHEDPRVQWVVPLNGTWHIEAQDGASVDLPPGTVFLGEDLGTKPDAHGHKGHLSEGANGAAVALMQVGLGTGPVADRPCHVK